MPLNQPANVNSRNKHNIWWLVAILYCFSGTTSLAYEVLWSRMLSMQFGVSIFGVVITVAAFMFGLGAGSLAGIRWARKSKEPIAVFAALEAGIAIYALLLPTLLQHSNGWMEGVSTQLTLLQWYLLQGAGAFCLLLVPAFGMGVGFALVIKVIEQTPISLGTMYGLNTLGGVAGAIFPLWSLPAIGWAASVRVIAVLGLVVGIAAFAVSRAINQARALQGESRKQNERPPTSALLIYAGIGAGSIMLEIGWVRLYGMIMLRTEYVLGLILAVFLLGIALGSMFLPQLKKFGLSTWMPFVVGGGVLLGLFLLPATSAWIEQSDFKSFFLATTCQALILGVFTLPITLALGAWLPLLASRYDHTESGGVWLYGANCLGGSAGAVIACLICIPLLGSAGMVALCAVAITAFGLIWVNTHWAWLGLAAVLAAAWPLRIMPPVDALLPRIEADSRNLYLYEDAISLTHVIRQPDGQRVLLSDLQRMDASTDPSAVEIQKDQARLALLLHPAPKSVLFLGLGTGISVAGSKPFPGLIRSAVELSQGSINSAKYLFSPVNDNILDQVQIQRDDARHFLSSTQRHYDVIVGDLFHPDIAGMGSLLSVQQFERAKDRLNKDGVFVQWLALNQFEVESLRVVLRSFQRVYPNAQLFMDGMHLALVGPKNEFSGANSILQNLGRMDAAGQSQATGGEGAWTWIGRYWGPIAETNGTVQDEWEPYIEYKLPRARYDGNVNLANLMSWLLQRHPEPDTAMKILAIDANDRSKFGRDYVATELTARAWVSSIQGDAAKAGNLIWLAYQANPQDRWIANSLADSMWQSLAQAKERGLSEREALQRIIKVYPSHVGALRALWHLESTEGKTQVAEQYRSRLLASSPLDSEAKLIQ